MAMAEGQKLRMVGSHLRYLCRGTLGSYVPEVKTLKNLITRKEKHKSDLQKSASLLCLDDGWGDDEEMPESTSGHQVPNKGLQPNLQG